MRSHKIKTACFLVIVAALANMACQAESWSQINQKLQAPQGWQRIVSGSPFTLGERRTVTVENGRTFAEIGYGTYPSIDGSTVAVPMAMEFARQHLGLGEADLTGFVAFSTTHMAYEHLIHSTPNGSAPLITQNAVMEDTRPVDLFIGTEPSDDELALAGASGVTLIKEPVCYDAFVFIVHADNPVQSLTAEQIQRIYMGEIVSWQEVGGSSEVISPYQRNKNSGSQTAMENLVMQGKPMSAVGASGYYVNEMSALVFAIGGDSSSIGSIGYTFKYYIDELYKDDAIKILAVDGFYPSEENVRSGAYPFATNYYGVIRAGDEDAPGGLFLDWMLTQEGQRCIRQAGYIPFLHVDEQEEE